MRIRSGLLLALSLLLLASARAQVPTLLGYQGRVLTGNTNFSGQGAFKFALIDVQTGETLWSNDGTSSAGSEPTAAVPLTVDRGNFDVLLGQTQLANMTQPLPASALTNGRARLRVWFDDGGNGSQRLTPDVRLAATGYTQRAATLEQGAVTAASLAAGSVNANALAAGSVTGPTLANGSVGAAQLATGAVGAGQLAAGAVGTGQLAAGAIAANLAASGLAGVPAGGIVLSATRDNAALLAAGYVRIGQTQLEPEGWTQQRSGPFSHYDNLTSAIQLSSIVWTGREVIRWGGLVGTVTYLSGGTRYDPRSDLARTTTLVGAPAKRGLHTAVWTGAEMIVWGGSNQLSFSQKADGGRYDPALDRWTPVGSVGAPAARDRHSAVWTGSEMIVWGGAIFQSPNVLSTNTGARYSPATDTWTPMTLTNAPEARSDHSAVWTGSEMLVWGNIGGTFPQRGARYSPTADTWTHFTTVGAPAARKGHGLVWTGSELLVWGGYVLSGGNTGSRVAIDNGGRYRPDTDTWSPLNAAGGPPATMQPGVVWTGTRMLAWNGTVGASYDPQGDTWTPLDSSFALEAPNGDTTYLDRLRTVWTGTEWYIAAEQIAGGAVFARYSPARDRWEPVLSEPVSAGSVSPALPQRYNHSAVWTGRQLVVVSGRQPDTQNEYGASFSYDPATRRVASIAINGGNSGPEDGCSALWTGTQVLVFGRQRTTNAVFSARYDPQTDLSLPLSATGQPAYRTHHSAVWTGSEMIVFGGQPFTSGGTPLVDGARYSLAANAWTALPATGRPAGRTHHRAVWTGAEMIVWGGEAAGGIALGDGARFDPQANLWIPISSVGAPSPRSRHALSWTGAQLLVWGGRGADGAPLRDGFSYDPATDTWRPLPAPPASLSAAELPYHAWNGEEWLLFGGVDANGLPLAGGARFDPAAGTWATLEPRFAPPARLGATMTWTGSEWLHLGGQGTGVSDAFFLDFYLFAEVHSYRPPRRTWLYQRP